MKFLKLSILLPCLLALLGVTIIGCGDESNPAGATTGATELQGTWVGAPSGTSNQDWKFVVTGNVMAVYINGIESYQGNFTLNTATDPKQLTCNITASTEAQYVGKQALAIYRLNGASLDFAGNEPGNPNRPTTFSGSETMVIKLSKWQ